MAGDELSLEGELEAASQTVGVALKTKRID
jgi:hypothetical protein